MDPVWEQIHTWAYVYREWVQGDYIEINWAQSRAQQSRTWVLDTDKNRSILAANAWVIAAETHWSNLQDK